MATTKTLTLAEIDARIAELSRTPAALVGSDEGTHAGPTTYRTYETVTGERFTVRNSAGFTTIVAESRADTSEGLMRSFPLATDGIRRAAAELKARTEQRRRMAR